MFHQENISHINNNLISDEKTNILINKYKDKIFEETNNNNKISLNSYKNNIMSFGNGNKIKLNYHHIKYGIDENGNPINIKEYYKSINDSVYLNSNSSMQSGISNFTQKLKKPIAYITKDEKNNNILVDLKGNKITTKNKEGDYDYNLQLHVIIKDFDVKHPELRVNGERNYNNESMEEINEEPSENIKEKEKVFSHINNNIGDSLRNINFNLNHNNDNTDLIAGSCFSSSVRNDDKIIFRNNTNTYSNIGKYYNILGKNSRNNKIVLRTKYILTNNNTSAFKNNISSQNNKYINFDLEKGSKSLNKNNSEIIPLKRSNTINSNFINFKNQRDNNKKDDTKNKKKAINLLLINNYSSKINKKDKESPKIAKIGNKSDNHPKIINSGKKTKKKFNCPRKTNSEKNTIQKILNHNFYNNKKLSTSTNLLNNNIINEGIKFSNNYFVIKHKKSASNSKLIKKNYKRPNKRTNFIQINDKNNSSTKNNYFIDNKKESRQNISNNINHKITKKNILKKDLSQKSKKIEIQKKEKIINLQNMLKKNKYSHMYILSEEANKMIRSFSKNNIRNENQLNSSIRKLHTSQLNFKMTKAMPVSKESSSINNSLHLGNTYFSPINRNSKTNCQNIQNISKYDSNKINERKYVGITLSLLNNENKNLKSNTNNQININFSPYQIQCESLVKSNSHNLHQRVNYNNSEKKNSKVNNKYKMNHINKNFLSPKYQIYL